MLELGLEGQLTSDRDSYIKVSFDSIYGHGQNLKFLVINFLKRSLLI